MAFHNIQRVSGTKLKFAYVYQCRLKFMVIISLQAVEFKDTPNCKPTNLSC